MSITGYQVVKSPSPGQLASAVNAMLGSVQPFGHVFKDNDGQFCQMMIAGSQVLVGATGATGTTGTTGSTGATGATGASAAVQTFYGTSSSAANTYAITIAGATVAQGNIFAIKLDHAPTGATTWNVNGDGAKAVVLPNGAALSGTQGVDGQTFWAVYDGAKYVLAVTPNNA